MQEGDESILQVIAFIVILSHFKRFIVFILFNYIEIFSISTSVLVKYLQVKS